MKKISLFIVYFISLIYMEFLYRICIYDNVFRLSNINMLLFLIPISILFMFISKIFKEKPNKIIFYILLCIITIWFCAEYVVKDYFDFYISLETFSIADQITSFASKGIIETLKRIPIIIAFFIPFILSIVFNKRLDFERYSIKKIFVLIGLFIASFIIYILGLNIKKNDSYSPYELFYNVNNVNLNIEYLGITNSFFIDIYRNIFGFEEKIIISSTSVDEDDTDVDIDTEIEYEYNNLDIDFASLAEDEDNATIKSIHEYMASSTGTLKNEYTGIFEGKNLILFMAESFNEIAVSEELTPTLYKLVNGGFSFTNFYTPTIYSTIGGEFQELTGLYAESTSVLSTFRSGDVYFPQGIATVFNNLGYSTYAYHNNSYSFQDRNDYLASLGFTNFTACYNGLEDLINCKEWPQSDVDMINATVSDYINDDNFMVFYATVSGHASYSWSGNAQAKKHKSEYLNFNLPYSEGPASYLAAQMELDQALEALINALDEAGVLEDTVIALVGDHYPYELTLDEINEVSTYEKDYVTVNKSNFILWNSEMDTVVVDKVGSQIDVMPTIYNVFGIEYDSRLFMGSDILSTTAGLAIFANRSWVTDKGIYYADTGTFVANDGVEVTEDYIKKVNQIVSNKINMSKLIIQNNYYKYVM